MPWNSTTEVMTAPLNLYSKNGAYGDIQQAVRCPSPDLGVCIRDGHINEWSPVKPVRFNKLGPLTAQDFADANYGFRLVPTYEGNTLLPGVFANNYEEVFDNALYYKGKWPYDRPRGLSYNERFRYYDFVGYHGEGATVGGYAAVCPTSSSTYEVVQEGGCPFTLNNATLVEIQLDELSYNAPEMEDFNFSTSRVYFLYKMRGGNTYSAEYAGLTFAQLQNDGVVTHNVNLTLPGKTDQVYDIVAAVTSWDGDPENVQEDDVWVYLPNTLQSVTVKKQYNALMLYLYNSPTTGYANSFKVTRTFNQDSTSGCSVDVVMTIGNELVNGYGTGINITSLTVYGYLYDSTHSELARTSLSYGALSYGTYDTISFTVEELQDVSPSATLSDLYFRVEFYYSTGGSNIMRYFDFENDCGTSSVISEDTLANIKSYYNIQ